MQTRNWLAAIIAGLLASLLIYGSIGPRGDRPPVIIKAVPGDQSGPASLQLEVKPKNPKLTHIDGSLYKITDVLSTGLTIRENSTEFPNVKWVEAEVKVEGSTKTFRLVVKPFRRLELLLPQETPGQYDWKLTGVVTKLTIKYEKDQPEIRSDPDGLKFDLSAYRQVPFPTLLELFGLYERYDGSSPGGSAAAP